MIQGLFINWAVGAINGYKQKEKGLPADIKYGTIGVTSIASMLRVLPTINLRGLPRSALAQRYVTLFMGTSLVMGTNFYAGHHLGKALRYLDDGD